MDSVHSLCEVTLGSIVERSPLGIYVVDAGFHLVSANPAAMEVFRSVPEAIGRRFEEVMLALWPQESAEEVIRRHRHTLRTGEPYMICELVHECRDTTGTQCYEWQVERIRLSDARHGVVCYFRDISAHVIAQRAIAEAEARFRSIVDQSFCGIAEADPTGRLLAVNDRFCCMLGYSRQELLGLRIEDITHPDDVPRGRALFEALVAGGTSFEIEKRYFHKHGSTVWVHNSVTAIRDAQGSIRSFIAVSIDVTERRRTEAVIRRAAEADAYRVALADALRFITDPHEIQTEAARVLCGHLQASCVYYTELLPGPEGLVIGRCYGERGGEGGGPYVVGPLRMSELGPETFDRLRKGQRVVVDDLYADPSVGAVEKATSAARGILAYVCVPIVKGGRLIAYFGACQFSARRWTASEIALVEETAERTWAAVQRARAETVLRESEERLRRSDRHKDEFLATLSHELRNPLAPIHHALIMLEQREEASPQARRLLQLMERQVDHLVRMVDDLLEVSRISRGKIELRTELVDVGTIVRTAIETSQPLIDAAEHELIVSMPPQPLTVVADPLRISQVLTNLLNNAAKYTKAGGRIWLTVRSEAGDVVLSVRDDGVGIPAHVLPRIFEMFVQVDPDHERVQGGLGIGLAVVKKLVEMHGGTVEARSSGSGEGSEIVVRLPAGPPAAVPPLSEPEPELVAARASCRILVVDDNADAATMLGMLLEAKGHEVRVVLDGPAALRALAAERPHVVFLDLGMPGMSGYEVAQRVREDPAHVGITLVAVTGWGQAEDRRRTQAAGFHHHLTKPVDLPALEELLAVVWREAHARPR
jgi:PAS domain S-box-containing protein